MDVTGPGGGYEAEPADLVGASGRFISAGDEVDRALATLRSTLGGLGDYLGSDEQGQAFKAAYEPKVREAETAVDGLARGLSSIGPALSSAGEQYRGDDAAAAGRLNGQIRP